MNLPKILIVNQPFNTLTGGGITLSNLFAGWKKENLAVVCHNYLLENVDLSICDNYYQLGYKEHTYSFPFSLFKKNHFSGRLEFNFAEVLNKTEVKPKSKFRVKVIVDYFFPVLKFLGLYNNISYLHISEELLKWLNDFNPDVIYAQATSREEIGLILLLKDLLKKPLIFHMMDDWPAMIAEKGLFKNKEKIKNEASFYHVMQASNVLMSISEQMSNVYKQRYGKNFIPFHNPIDIDFWQRYQRDNYKITTSPTILYAGRLGLGIDESLKLVAEAITQVNNDLNFTITLVLQTKDKPGWISDFKNIEHRSFVLYDELPKSFSEADLLIIPYDFSPQSIQFFRYSMPTKATEYMISGTPIMIFAPAETAVVKYAEKYRIAAVVTDNNLDCLASAIKDLILNDVLRRELATNAVKLARENHSSEKVTQEFKNVICNLTAVR